MKPRRLLWCVIMLMFFMSIGQTQGLSRAQEVGTPDATTVNRIAEMAYIEYVRNGSNPNLILLLFAPQITMYSPFAPLGSIETAQQNARDEMLFQKSAKYNFTQWVLLTEGDLAAVAAYQKGSYVDEFFGISPDGEELGEPLLWIDRLIDGHICEGYTAWDQQLYLQDMHVVPVEYERYTLEPWAVTLGTTSSTPEDHHVTLNRFYDNLCTDCSIDFESIYTDDVQIHDYADRLNGLPAVSEHLSKITQLHYLRQYKTLVVCEGNLCISYAINFFAGAEAPQWLIWAALHRFEDGKIAEEWWMYDNAVLWHAVDW